MKTSSFFYSSFPFSFRPVLSIYRNPLHISSFFSWSLSLLVCFLRPLLIQKFLQDSLYHTFSNLHSLSQHSHLSFSTCHSTLSFSQFCQCYPAHCIAYHIRIWPISIYAYIPIPYSHYTSNHIRKFHGYIICGFVEFQS